VRTFQLEEARIRATLDRINKQKIIIKRISKPTPFAFPLIVDRLREMMSSERLEDRIQKLLSE
jgi:ATP-dependent Lhr-like helicase